MDMLEYSGSVGMFAGFLIGAGFLFFFLKNLYDLLKAVREQHRDIVAGAVWLMALPVVYNLLVLSVYYFAYANDTLLTAVRIGSFLVSVFAALWNFRVVLSIAHSIQDEYESRGLPVAYRPAYQTGLIMCIGCLGMLLQNVPYIAVFGQVSALVYLTGLILYWVKIYKYKKEIRAMAPPQEDEDSLIFKDL